MPVSITLLYSALLALVLIALSMRIVLLRRKHRVGIGVGEVRLLERAVRAHGNFCEYVPFALVLLLLLDLAPAVSDIMIHVLGAALLLGRILHAIGLNQSAGTTFGRFVGTLLTWFVILVSALYGLWLAIGWL
ncbi:MAG: MAPEG family protein [Pseudomonadota bacterium]